MSHDVYFKDAKRKQTAAASKTGSDRFVWVEEDEEGNPLPKRSRSGEGRKRGSSTGGFSSPIFLMFTLLK